MTARSADRDALRDLAALLARGFLRLRQTLRTSAVSCEAGEQIPLEVPGPARPDERELPDVLRAS